MKILFNRWLPKSFLNGGANAKKGVMPMVKAKMLIILFVISLLFKMEKLALIIAILVLVS
ncbi:MAG: hypothetical protein DKM24_01510 [Candidatus Melainabacteria bacterium]|nr:MAG: hypothetical protein DKM24_01510 [Candidatus Melainabacteria bacterium]